MTDPAQLPRVTYAAIDLDVGPIHDHFDALIPAIEANLAGRAAPNLIGGMADEEGAPRQVRSPIDGTSVLGTLIDAAPAAVDRAVAAARAAQPEWRAMGWSGRVAALRAVADEIAERRFDLAAATVLEVGKSRIEAIGEVEEAADLVRHYCDEAERTGGFDAPLKATRANETGRDLLIPFGVFAVVSPFNFPVALPCNMMGAALAAGNAVVWKPTPGAVYSGPMLAEIFARHLPAGAFNMVAGGAAVGERLTAHPGVDGVAFTGSHEVGMSLLRQAGAGRFMKPVLAEMGGKNPAFVTASADLDAAAWGAARSVAGLSGQKCSACSKLYVQRGVADAFTKRLTEILAGLAIADPRGRDAFTGPVIDDRAAARFDAACAAAKRGGRVLAGGGRAPLNGGAYCAPTLVADLPADHDLQMRELFTPFATLQLFDDLGSAIEDANRVAFGLTAGLYAREKAELDLFCERIEAGALYVNRPSGATTGAWPGYQSFTGWKGSGTTGKGGLGPHYLPQFLREQSRTVVWGS